jgi:hypothetical protein
VQVAPNAINVTSSGGGAGTSSDVHTMAEAFGQAIETRLAKSELLRNVANGVT